MNKMDNEFASKLIEEIKTTKKVNPTKPIKLDDLIYKDNTGKTLLEYMLENNIPYYYNLIPGLSNDYEIVKYFFKYNKMKELTKISQEVYLSQTEENVLFLEQLLQSNKIDELHNITFEYDKRILDLLIKYNRKDLLKNIKFTEFKFVEVLEQLLELNILEYITIPDIEFYGSIYDILNKHNKLALIELIPFTEDLLLQDYRNSLIRKIINSGYTPNLSNATIRTVDFLYEIDRPDILVKIFDNEDNLYLLFDDLGYNSTVLDYVLGSIRRGFQVNLRTLGENIDTLDTEDLVKAYITFSKHSQLEYLYKLEKEELLKRNINRNCMLDEFISHDLNETKFILEYFRLDRDIDIIMFFKLKGFNLGNEKIDFELLDEEAYSYEIIKMNNALLKSQIKYEELQEEDALLLIELEELFIDSDSPELVEAIILSFAKEIKKNNIYALEELKKLIQIKKMNPDLEITKSTTGSFFSRNAGLNLATAEINTINHELGHLFHYYLDNEDTPLGFEDIIRKLQQDENLLEKTTTFSKLLRTYEDELEPTIDKEYDEWSEDYYTEDKIQEIQEFLSSSKQDKIEYYKKLGYKEEELALILDESFTLEQYMENQKRIKCSEMLSVTMSAYHSELQAISDIIDAIYEGHYYNNKLLDKNGERIEGTFGHGIVYYSSIDNVFQEIFANYSLLMKSDRREQSFMILKEIVGEELINYLHAYYFNKILYSQEYAYQGNITL